MGANYLNTLQKMGKWMQQVNAQKTYSVKLLKQYHTAMRKTLHIGICLLILGSEARKCINNQRFYCKVN